MERRNACAALNVAMGHARPGRAGSKSVHVGYAPKAEVDVGRSARG
jgi:hypothetical protein